MKEVYQTKVCNVEGDCERACVASLFELKIEQVPNFVLFKESAHFIYANFLYLLGYNYKGYMQYLKEGPNVINVKETVNGYTIASVNSSIFADTLHAVIIDKDFNIVHDPNPNKKYLGVNAIERNILDGWDRLELSSRDIKQYTVNNLSK